MLETEVLILGAGPTGLTLALELSLQHISFQIIDAAPARNPHSRAIVLQSRSLELLCRHNVTDKLLAHGTQGNGLRVFVTRRLIGELNFSDIPPIDSQFPLPLWISQADTEGFLEDALAAYDGPTVRRPLVAETVIQDDTGVTVGVRNALTGEEDQIRARYVVGCDGAHSIVRRAAGLEFVGATYAQEFLLADLHVKWDGRDEGDGKFCLFLDKALMVGFPMEDGLWRVIAVRKPGAGGVGNGDEEPTLEDVRNLWNAMVPGKAMLADPVWMSKFKLHHRLVECYRRSRLFVAGDAAHIHSPAGGQGMNTGIQDAVNLGWKLAAVLRGESNEALLDSYDPERRPVGEHLLKYPDRVFQYVSSGHPVIVFLRNLLLPWLFPWVFSNLARKTRMYRFISQLGIRYRRSPVVGTGSTFKGLLRGGDRAPDATLQGPDGAISILGLCTGPGHHFFIYSGIGTACINDTELQQISDSLSFANTHKILSKEPQNDSGYFDKEEEFHARYSFTESGYVFVRPDGHLAHIGYLSAIDEFKAWFKGYMISTCQF